MSEFLMALGEFRFALSSAAYSAYLRQRQFRWAEQARWQRSPALQFIGQGEHTLHLEGIIYPHFRGGLRQIVQMRTMGARGEPLLLVNGDGTIEGRWVILSVEEEQAIFLAAGQPQKQKFRLSLRYYGEEALEI